MSFLGVIPASITDKPFDIVMESLYESLLVKSFNVSDAAALNVL